MFKKKLLLLTLSIVVPTTTFADETLSEKANAGSKSSVRAMKKGANRVKEAFCTEGDLKCGAKKAGNRASEMKDSVMDGASEAKGKLD